MNVSLRTFSLFVCLLSLRSVVAAGGTSLVERSPFEPVDKPGEGVPAAPDPTLEFRGLIEEDHRYLFSIFDVATKRSAWTAEGAATRTYRVQSYDPRTGVLRVLSGDKTIALTMKGTALPAALTADQSAVAGQDEPKLPAAGTAVARLAVAAPAAEIRRLAPLVEEIRRRKALLLAGS
jgi:hypothetical protein